MLQYRLQPVGNFRCDYATGADFCDAFVTSTDSSYLLAFLLTANHEADERCFVAALDQAFKANAVFKEWATSWIRRILQRRRTQWNWIAAGEGSINAGTVKPCRNSAFVLLVLAKASLALSRSWSLWCSSFVG